MAESQQVVRVNESGVEIPDGNGALVATPDTPQGAPPALQVQAADAANPADNQLAIVAGPIDFSQPRPFVAAGEAKVATTTAKYPVPCLLLGLTICGVIIGMGWGPVTVNGNLKEFQRASYNETHRWEALQAAQAVQPQFDDLKLRWSSDADTGVNTLVHRFRLSLLYAGEDLTSEASLTWMRGVEQKLRSLPGWSKFCPSSEQGLDVALSGASCTPGVSLANYAWPDQAFFAEFESVDQGKSRLMRFDGSGRELLSLETIRSHLESTKTQDYSTVFPASWSVGQQLTAIRSGFEFMIPLPSPDSQDETNVAEIQSKTEEYEAFVKNELFPALEEELDRDEDEDRERRLFFTGDVLTQFELLEEVHSHAIRAVWIVLLVLLYFCFHTRSLVIPIIGTGLIFLAVLTTFCIYRWTAGGSGEMALTNFMAAYVMLGLGSETFFAVTESWRASVGLFKLRAMDGADTVEKWANRLRWTYREAFWGSLAACVTASLSFLIQLSSPLRPIREFGFLLGCGLIVSFVLLVGMLPPALILHAKLSRKFFPALSNEDGKSSAAMLRALTRMEPEEENSTALRDFLTRFMVTTLLPRIERHQRKIVGVVLFLSIVFMAVGAAATSVDPSVVRLFSSEHNLEKSSQLEGTFAEFKPRDPAQSVDPDLVCSPTGGAGSSVRLTDTSSCAMLWCPVKALATPGSSCRCFRQFDTGSCQSQASSIQVRGRFVGLRSLPARFEASWLQRAESFMRAQNVSLSEVLTGRVVEAAQVLPSLTQEHWESGTSVVQPVWQGPTMEIPLASLSRACDYEEICYCESASPCSGHAVAGSVIRKLSYEWPEAQPSFDPYSRRLHEDSAEQRRDSEVAEHLFAHVSVVFGIEAPGNSYAVGPPSDSIWKYDPDFNAENIHAQRALLSICSMSGEQQQDLAVQQSNCWVTAFQEWLANTMEGPDRVFPTRQFDTFIRQFVMTEEGSQYANEFWWGPDGAVRATKVSFLLSELNGAEVSQAFELKERWDAYVKGKNEAASINANRAFHTSELWVRVTTAEAINRITAGAMFAAFGIGCLGVLLSTKSIAITVIVMLTVACLLVWQVFLLACVMGFELTSVEIMTLVVFSGKSFTHFLPLAKAYTVPKPAEGRSPTRLERVQYAMASSASSVVGCAVTTVISCVLLFGAGIVVYFRFAGVVAFVTLLSAFFALTFLPALLMVIGPSASRCGVPCPFSGSSQVLPNASAKVPEVADGQGVVPG